MERTPAMFRYRAEVAGNPEELADELADDYGRIASSLTAGRIDRALDVLDRAIPLTLRFYRFLSMADVELTRTCSGAAPAVAAMHDRLGRLLAAVELAVARNDMVALAVITRCGLSVLMREYQNLADWVTEDLTTLPSERPTLYPNGEARCLRSA